MVRPGLENIPFLSTLPDIPYYYASNPAFSFFVDLILLCGLFAALMSPLGSIVLGRGDAEGKKAGKKFGAIFGIILGAGSAFALRAAGISLFQFWLTMVIAAALIGAVLFVILRHFHVNPWIAGIICAIIGWMALDSFFVTSQSQTVRNIFGFFSLMLPMVFLLFIIWALTQMKGRGGGGEGGPSTPAPRPPGYLKRMFGEHGLLGAPKKIWEKIKYGQHPPTAPSGIPAQRIQQETEQLGRDNDTANEITDQAEQQSGQIATGAEAAAKEAEQAKGAAGGAITAADQGNVEEFRKQIEALLARILRLQKYMERLKSNVTKLLKLGPTIEKIIQDYNTHIRSLQTFSAQTIANMQNRIRRLPYTEGQRQLLAELEALRRDIVTLEKSLGILNAIAERMNNHLAFLRINELQALSEQLGQQIKTLSDMSKNLNARKDAIKTKADLQTARRALEAVFAVLNAARDMFRQLVVSTIRNSAQLKELRKDIKQWKNVFDKTTKLALQNIPRAINALETRIIEQEVAARHPQQPTPQVPVAEIGDIQEKIKQNARILKALSDNTQETINHFNYPSPIIRTGRGRTQQAEIDDNTVEALRIAKRDGNFDATLAARIPTALEELKTAAQQIDARLATQGVASEETAQLTQLKTNMANFVRIINSTVIPILVNLDNTTKQVMTSFLQNRRSVTISNDVITNGIKQVLSTLIQQINRVLQPLLGRPPLARPRRVM